MARGPAAASTSPCWTLEITRRAASCASTAAVTSNAAGQSVRLARAPTLTATSSTWTAASNDAAALEVVPDGEPHAADHPDRLRQRGEVQLSLDATAGRLTDPRDESVGAVSGPVSAAARGCDGAGRYSQ